MYQIVEASKLKFSTQLDFEIALSKLKKIWNL